jgi:hypothetical protein
MQQMLPLARNLLLVSIHPRTPHNYVAAPDNWLFRFADADMTDMLLIDSQVAVSFKALLTAACGIKEETQTPVVSVSTDVLVLMCGPHRLNLETKKDSLEGRHACLGM